MNACGALDVQSSRALLFSLDIPQAVIDGPPEKAHLGLGSGSARFRVPRQRGRKRETHMNLNQLTIIGFIGRNAEVKPLPNGTPVTKFSVATTRSWKDKKGEWKDRTQWHTVVAFGQGFAQMGLTPCERNPHLRPRRTDS